MKPNLQAKPRCADLARLLMIVVLLDISAQSAAGMMMPLSVEELTRTSDSIAIGEVINVGKILSKETPVRTVTVRVEQYLKNDLGLSTLKITVLGGSLSNMTVWAEDQPSFEAGERTLLFLSKRADAFYVNGLFQGKYRLENGQAINQDSSRNTSERVLLLKIRSTLSGIEVERSIPVLAAIGTVAAIIAVILIARHASLPRPLKEACRPPI